MYYIGLDVHKRIVSYCVKDDSGATHAEGAILATRLDLDLGLHSGSSVTKIRRYETLIASSQLP